METRHQTYREKAHQLYTKVSQTVSYDQSINYIQGAIALISQIEREYMTDDDKRDMALYYNTLANSIENVPRRIELMRTGIRYAKKIKEKNPADEFTLAKYHDELGNLYSGYVDEKAKTEYTKAITILTNIVKNNPYDKKYHIALAKLYAKIKDYKSAVIESEKVNPKTTDDIVDLCNYYIKKGDQDHSEKNYTNALTAYSKVIELLSVYDMNIQNVRHAFNNASSRKVACMSTIYRENKKAKARQNPPADDNSSSSESESNLRKNSVFASTASTTAAPAPAKEKSRQTEQPRTKHNR